VLIFDPNDHAYLGSTFEAQLEFEVVNQVGQRP
jgi:hypothetical protein